MIELTEEAIDVIRRSLELAGANASEVGVRLRVAGGEVRPRFVPAPEPGDETLEIDGLRVFVARSIVDEHGDIEIYVTPEHETLAIRPLG